MTDTEIHTGTVEDSRRSSLKAPVEQGAEGTRKSSVAFKTTEEKPTNRDEIEDIETTGYLLKGLDSNQKTFETAKVSRKSIPSFLETTEDEVIKKISGKNPVFIEELRESLYKLPSSLKTTEDKVSRTISENKSEVVEESPKSSMKLPSFLKITEDKGNRKISEKNPEFIEELRKSVHKLPSFLKTTEGEESRKSSDKKSEAVEESLKGLKKLPSFITTEDEGSRKSSQNKSEVVEETRKGLEKSLETTEDEENASKLTMSDRAKQGSDKPNDRGSTSHEPVASPEAQRPIPAPRRIPPQKQANQHSLATVQAQAAHMLEGFTHFLPREYRGELWIYAAGYVFLYSLLMLFTTSTFGFICMMIYVALVTLLVMRFFEIGPLVSRRGR